MLVLSRHRDESIHIGHDVVITVADIRGDKVRLAIEAPASVEIQRAEIYRRKYPSGPRPGAEAT